MGPSSNEGGNRLRTWREWILRTCARVLGLRERALAREADIEDLTGPGLCVRDTFDGSTVVDVICRYTGLSPSPSGRIEWSVTSYGEGWDRGGVSIPQVQRQRR
jgi:hypothetical protein